jgi:hypothetical protein
MLPLSLPVLVESDILAVPKALAILGVSLLLVASVQLTMEAHAALQSNRLEISFFQDLRKRRESKTR